MAAIAVGVLAVWTSPFRDVLVILVFIVETSQREKSAELPIGSFGF